MLLLASSNPSHISNRLRDIQMSEICIFAIFTGVAAVFKTETETAVFFPKPLGTETAVFGTR